MAKNKGGMLSNYLFSTEKKSDDAQLLETMLKDCGLLPSEERATQIYIDAIAAGIPAEDARILAGIGIREAFQKMVAKESEN